MRSLLIFFMLATVANATALDEVNHWRTKNGLNALTEDPALTKFAQKKAEYRAARLLKNGHQGPRCPAGCREGCGEAKPFWGWLTCCMEETGNEAGAGVAVGEDGERCMVLIMKGTKGHAPRGRKIGHKGCSLKIINTSHLTPDAPCMPRIFHKRKVCRSCKK